MKDSLFIFVLLASSAFYAHGQSLIVRNYHNPDGIPARDAVVSITGARFTDEELIEPRNAPFELGGVTVWIEGVQQRIRSVTPDEIVIVPDRKGAFQRGGLVVRTKFGEELSTTFRVLDIWPAIVIVGKNREAKENAIPQAIWVIEDRLAAAPVSAGPVPVSLNPAWPTKITLFGSGWRHSRIDPYFGLGVRLNGVPCKVVTAYPSLMFAGEDELVFEIPAQMAGRGPVDLQVYVGRRVSNAARIVLGEGVR